MATVDPSDSKVIYREDIAVLIGLVESQIGRTAAGDNAALIGLGYLHIKLSNMLATAPGMPRGRA